MSNEWYRISNPINLSGYESDEFSASATQSFAELLQSFIGTSVTIHNQIGDTGTVQKVIIQNATTDIITSAYLRQVLAPIGTLRCGQYIQDDVGYWLVCSLPDNNMMYEKAMMWFCKNTVKLTITHNNKDVVVEYPVYSINSTQYGSGETTKAHMTVPSAQHLVYIANDQDTINIESGYRFLLDRNTTNPTPYIITQVDSTSYSAGTHGGVIQWSVMADQYRESKDDSNNMVADNTKSNDDKGGW